VVASGLVAEALKLRWGGGRVNGRRGSAQNALNRPGRREHTRRRPFDVHVERALQPRQRAQQLVTRLGFRMLRKHLV